MVTQLRLSNNATADTNLNAKIVRPTEPDESREPPVESEPQGTGDELDAPTWLGAPLEGRRGQER